MNMYCECWWIFSSEHYAGTRLGLHIPGLVWSELLHSVHRLDLVGKKSIKTNMMAHTNFVLCFLSDMILEVVLKVEILAIHADIHPTVAGFFFQHMLTSKTVAIECSIHRLVCQKIMLEGVPVVSGNVTLIWFSNETILFLQFWLLNLFSFSHLGNASRQKLAL